MKYKKNLGFTPLNSGCKSQSLRHLTGFTLIELLIVVAIIGVLVTVAIIVLNTARVKARDAKRISDVKQISTALELYSTVEGSYPPTLTPGQSLVGPTSGSTFMQVVPQNPTPRTDGNCSNSEYIYTSYANTSYSLSYCLGTQVTDVTAGSHDAVPNNIAASSCGLSCAAGTVCVGGTCVADCATNTDKSKPCPASPSFACKCGGGTVFDTSNRLIVSPSNCINSTTCTEVMDSLSYNWNNAVNFCSTLTVNGQTWRMPSATELHALCLVKASVDGNFDTSGYYWTGTDVGGGMAASEAIDLCVSQPGANKTVTYPFRCIRSY